MPLPWPARQITFKPPNLVQVLHPPKKNSQPLAGKSLEGREKGKEKTENDSGEAESSQTHRASAATTSGSSTRRLVSERLISPLQGSRVDEEDQDAVGSPRGIVGPLWRKEGGCGGERGSRSG